MPLWWNPLICCPTAHYFPNDIWDATVKGTERSISPAFQSNLLWEGNNMSISEGRKKRTGWPPVWMWARSLKPQRLTVALGVIFNLSSKRHIPCEITFVAAVQFGSNLILFQAVSDWRRNFLYRETCFENDLKKRWKQSSRGEKYWENTFVVFCFFSPDIR